MQKTCHFLRHLKVSQHVRLSHLLYEGKSLPFRRFFRKPAEDPNFVSIVDGPPKLVRVGRQHGPGVIILGAFNPAKRFFKDIDSL